MHIIMDINKIDRQEIIINITRFYNLQKIDVSLNG